MFHTTVDQRVQAAKKRKDAQGIVTTDGPGAAKPQPNRPRRPRNRSGTTLEIEDKEEDNHEKKNLHSLPKLFGIAARMNTDSERSFGPASCGRRLPAGMV